VTVGNIVRTSSLFLILLLLGFLVISVFFPAARRLWLSFRAEEVTINIQATTTASGEGQKRSFKIVTLLGKDAIPAILNPRFITSAQAETQMKSSNSLRTSRIS